METKNKKGAEMTIGTIIIIILALVVLVFLIFAFTRGTGSLFDNIKNFFGGGANVQTVVSGCQTACATNGVYDWCRVRDVKFTDKEAAQPLRCFDLVSRGVGLEACSGITSCAGRCINTSIVNPGCDGNDFAACNALQTQKSNCTWTTSN